MKLDSTLIEGFVKSILFKSFDKATETPECHKEWWDLCCSDHKYVAIAAPRGHAKSTAITFVYVLAAVLFRFRDFVLIVSDTEGQAILFLNDIKKELIENEDIISLFGVEKLEKDAESDIIVRFNDGFKFRIMAKGSEQRVRGLKWRGKRPNLVVGDDLENDEIVMNPDRRNKFKRWVYGALLPCLSDDGLIRIVGTILHMDSFLENLMPMLTSKKTIVEDLKIYSKNKISGWQCIKYKAHSDDFSKILWPGKFTKEKLLWLKQDYTNRGLPDVYNQEYLNYPIDEGRAYFKRSDFLPVSESDFEDIVSGKKKLYYYVGVDLAISESTRADYTVFSIAGIDSEGMMYIVEVIRERMDGREIVDTLMEIQAKYKPELFAMEKDKIAKSIGPFLREEMFKRQQFPIIEGFVPSGDKEERNRSLQGRIRMHGVRFIKSEDWYPIVEQEMATFPRGTHDDIPDSLGLIGLALDKIILAPTTEEIEEEEYLNELRLNDEAGKDGRSRITGY